MAELLFFEVKSFTKWVKKKRLSKSVADLKARLTEDPELGDVIPGCSGVRKLRIGGHGRGKSGGFRVVYVLVVNRRAAVLLEGYSKSEKEDLTQDELVVLTKMIEQLEDQIQQIIGG